MKTTYRHTFVRLLGTFLGAATVVFSAWAQNQATLTPIGKWPDYPLPLASGCPAAVRVSGSYAYLAGYGEPLPASSEKATLELLTLDVSKPSQPRYLSHVDTLTDLTGFVTSPARMQIFGAYAYVTLVGDGFERSILAVFSLSEPALPRLVGTLALSGLAHGIDVVGDHAYVVMAISQGLPHGQLLVIDVSDPAHPTLKTTASLETLPDCISVAGDYAYVGGAVILQPGATYARVEIIDISIPGQAVVVGGFDLPEYDSGVLAIAAEGSLLHCCSRIMSATVHYDVFDRTDPLNPFLIGRWERGPDGVVTSLHVMGSTVILAGGPFLQGFCIFDVVDPQNPQFRGPVDLGPYGCDDLDVANDLAYLRDGGELRVLDIKDPAAPVQVGQIDTGFGGPLISIDGDFIYLLAGQRLRVLNVSNPRTPTLVGAKDLTYAGPFKVVDQHAYVAAGTFLQVLDLRNPSQPVEAGRFSVQATGLDVVGNRAYVFVANHDGTGWLKVIDVSNAQAPVELGSLYMPDGTPYYVQVVGDYALVQLYDTWLVIVDIRNPSSMVRVGGYAPTGYIPIGGVQVVGRYAYVLVHSEPGTSVHVVDLADPTNPTRVGRFLYDPGAVVLDGLYVSGGYAFVTFRHSFTADRHVDILDVRDPTQLVKVGEYDPQPWADYLDMVMVGNTLYTASTAGLTVLDFFAPNTSPRLRLNPPVLANGVAVVTWEGGPGIKLQKTTSLANPDWQDVPGTTGQSLAILPQTDAAFFRLTMP